MGVFWCFCKGLFSVGLYIFCHLILPSRVLSCNPMAFISIVIDLQEKFEDTKGVIWIRKSKHHFHLVGEGICLSRSIISILLARVFVCHVASFPSCWWGYLFVTYNWNIFLYNLRSLFILFLWFLFHGFMSFIKCSDTRK
jgi:hypothetical protein